MAEQMHPAPRPRTGCPLARDERGATAVEFSIVFATLTLLMFGIIEFAWAMSQWVWAEKATELGVRMAVVTDPVAVGLRGWDCGTGTTQTPGADCTDFAGSALNVRCYATSNDPAAAPTCDNWVPPDTTNPDAAAATAAFNNIVTRMQGVLPRVQRVNVVVEYVSNVSIGGVNTGLGFVSRPNGPVPMVSVSLRDMTHDFIVLGAMLGMFGGGGDNQLLMPGFRATLTGEDMRTVTVN